jgi:hypothetical protein
VASSVSLNNGLGPRTRNRFRECREG